MKILYVPFKIVSGFIGSRLGHSVFNQVWGTIDEADPPKATTLEASYSKVVGAAALEAATLAGVAAVVDRASARVFFYFTGIWPGDEKSEGSDEESEGSDEESEAPDED